MSASTSAGSDRYPTVDELISDASAIVGGLGDATRIIAQAAPPAPPIARLL
jgi:hypothetical protein